MLGKLKMYFSFAIVLLIPIISQTVCSAQTSAKAEEILVKKFENNWNNKSKPVPYLQTDKAIYRPGEELWFKFYILDDQTLDYHPGDSTLYLQMVNTTTNQVSWKERYQIKNGKCSGQLLIDSKILQGEYNIVAYSMSTYSDEHAQNILSTIRIVDENTPVVTLSSEISDLNETPQTVKKIKVHINKTTNVLQENWLLSAQIDNGEEILIREEKKIIGTEGTEFKLPIGQYKGPKRLILELRDANNTQIALSETMLTPVLKPFSFHSFPEGGELIAGLQSVIAFQITDSAGNPFKTSGYLTLNNTPMVAFNSNDNGLGSFCFKPVSDGMYKIIIKDGNNTYSYDLPTIRSSGVNLKFKYQDSIKAVFIVRKTPDIQSNMFYLRAQTKGRVLAIASMKVLDSTLLSIPIKDAPMGIIEFTLFDSELNPLCERLLFTGTEKRIRIHSKFNESKIGKRKQVHYTIKATDQYGKPVIADLAIKVVDSARLNTYQTKNIFSHSYLSSQLKGKIYNPASYFDLSGRTYPDQIDLLMLTHGWRNYVYKNPPELNLNSSGIKNRTSISISLWDGNKSITRESYFLLSSASNPNSSKILYYQGTSGIDISVADLAKANGKYLYLKPILPPDLRAEYSIEDNFSIPAKSILQITTPIKLPMFDKKNIPRQVGLENSITLNKVNVKGKAVTGSFFRDKFMKQLDSLQRLSQPVDYVTHGVVLNCPLCIGTEVKKEIPIDGKTYKHVNTFFYGSPKLHGFDWKSLSNVVYKRVTYSDEELLKLNNIFRFKGYYPQKVFYNTTYPDQNSSSDAVVDTRTTLLWLPSIITDQNGEAKISFYTSDINSTFNINFEGLSGNGILGQHTDRIRVR